MIIKINPCTDPRIAESFPNDPHSNLCILTTTQRLNLQHAFLSMDSQYFSKIDPDTHQVDLRQFSEHHLIQVLHSLYGQELSVHSISELAEVLPIILYLGIQQYRKNIQQQILASQELLENVQMLEISYQYKLLWSQVMQSHLNGRLRMLQSSKSYLKLGKVSEDTFNALLIEYLKRYGPQEKSTLNNIMENYFNRKSIKALQYFKKYNLRPLFKIWVQYHHVNLYDVKQPKDYQKLSNNAHSLSDQGQSITVKKNKSLAEKQEIVRELIQQCRIRDCQQLMLQSQIDQLRNILGSKSQNKSETTRSMFILPDPVSQNFHYNTTNPRLSDLSPEFKSCIYMPTSQKHLKRWNSGSQLKVLNRMGAKNMKRWA